MRKIAEIFRPKTSLSDEEAAAGLKWWTREGTASQGFWSITTSGFLAAYALTLGCNNFQIGVLAAIPLLTQPLQIAFIPLVEKLRWRKAIAFGAWVPAQLLWLPVALIPFFLDVPGARAIAVLLGLMALRGVFVAACVCAWNGWIRDLIPQSILGSSFGRRQARATLVGMVFGLLAAYFVDYWEGSASGDSEVWGYSFALLFGIFFLGLASPAFILKMPEPAVQPPPGPQPSLVSMMWEPFRDRNYRPLLGFLFLWGMALNLAIPFFAVYMLQRLELPLTAVIGFSALSQMFNIFFLRIWGNFSDQFGIKTILAMSASLYLLVILGWTFTTMPERYFLTIPLLVILHILAGIASAGVTLGTGTIAMKVAPSGKATSYLAVAAMATSLGAGLGPLIGGRFADYFSVRKLSIDINWIDPDEIIELSAVSFTGFDFLFGIAFLAGLFTLNALFAVREEGEVERDVVLNALYHPGQQFTRPMTSVPGLNFLGQFPYGFMRRMPIPGLDVALGVTSYQIAQTARVATEAAIRSGAATAKISKGLQESLSLVAGKSSRQGEPGHRFEVARQALRGAIGAIDEANEDVERLFRSAFNGVLRAFGWERLDLSEVIRGASYGAVQQAGETGGDTAKAARMAIDAAQAMAQRTGRDEMDAMTEAAAGALEAATAIGPDEAVKVEQSIPADLLPESSEENPQ
ncbi:MAG: MFS transporter [Dehalococcoidia bacterium]